MLHIMHDVFVRYLLLHNHYGASRCTVAFWILCI